MAVLVFKRVGTMTSDSIGHSSHTNNVRPVGRSPLQKRLWMQGIPVLSVEAPRLPRRCSLMGNRLVNGSPMARERQLRSPRLNMPFHQASPALTKPRISFDSGGEIKAITRPITQSLSTSSCSRSLHRIDPSRFTSPSPSSMIWAPGRVGHLSQWVGWTRSKALPSMNSGCDLHLTIQKGLFFVSQVINNQS